MIHVLADIEVTEGKREEFLELFHELMPAVHAEAGCIEYGPATDIDSGLEPQEPLRPNVVTVIEKWETLDALKAHLDIDHMHKFRETATARGLLAGISLKVLETA